MTCSSVSGPPRYSVISGAFNVRSRSRPSSDQGSSVNGGVWSPAMVTRYGKGLTTPAIDRCGICLPDLAVLEISRWKPAAFRSLGIQPAPAWRPPAVPTVLTHGHDRRGAGPGNQQVLRRG